MPWSVTWEPKGVYAKFLGTCPSKDLLDAFATIIGDPRLDSLRYAIFDYLDVEMHDATENEAEDAAAHVIGLSFTNPRIYFASVTRDERIKELWCHYLSLLTTPERQRLFEAISDARAWLAEQQSA
jgi:hypothetical protein